MEKKTVIFCTGNRGSKKLHDAEGKICEFVNSKSDVILGNEGLQRIDKKPNIWFVILDVVEDKGKIERIKKLNAFKNKEIWIADAAPQIANYEQFSALVAGGPNAQRVIDKAVNERTQKLEAEREQERKDVARYGQLFAQVCKAGGDFISGADPVLVQEFKDLQLKLGIKEEKEQDETNQN